jgi:hypothetical protein
MGESRTPRQGFFGHFSHPFPAWLIPFVALLHSIKECFLFVFVRKHPFYIAGIAVSFAINGSLNLVDSDG